MSSGDIPDGHGFKAGWLQGGIFRVQCLCGERFTGADSATAHAYWREHLTEVRETAEVEQ